MLYGRLPEVQQIGTLLRAARHGRSGALALTAEAGEGKSALLRYAAAQAADWRILRCSGVESESELPFAGLHLLLGSALDRLDTLPEPQRRALGGALGLCPSDGADRFLIGVATLTLLAELSTDGPVLCLIDDAHWLDRPSADVLRFAARRLGAEGIVMLFAGRKGFEPGGLSELRLGPLDATSAVALLTACSPSLSPDQRDRVLAEAAGNPLALLEFPNMHRDVSPAAPLPLPLRLQGGYERQIAAQTPCTRTALLVVAAEETGDLGVVLRALQLLGYTATALDEAELSGMVAVTGQTVSFRHPLQRSAAYHGASFTQRLAVHAAIAEVLADDPSRSAWHLAAASTGPDETVAAALESAAERARERTGHASAAIALERAATLTPDPDARARRLVLAVETAAQAGHTERARRLADTAERLPLGPVERARIGGTRGLLEFEHGSLRKAQQLMLDAAAQVAEIEPERAALLFVEAGRIAWTTGNIAAVTAANDRLAELPRDIAGPLQAALRGGLALLEGELAEGISVIRANVSFSLNVPLEMISVRLAFALQAALIGDMAIAREHLTELADMARARGMIGWFPAIGSTLATTEFILGRMREAELMATATARIAADIGQPSRVAGAEAVLALIAAVQGDEPRCRELAERNLRNAPGDHNAVDVTHSEWALGLLDLGTGRYEQALARLDALHRAPAQARGHWIDLLSDLIEAAVRLRKPERAEAAMAEIETWAAALDTPWAEGIVLSCQGMLRGDGALLARALELHLIADRRYDHARTALVYGEWLRRERRMNEARVHLRQALETFDRIGATPWAEHARIELRAAGEGSVPEPEDDIAARLTPQELQVVRLAAAGATNKEIAAQLFLSPKTVGHHLYRAFPKLGVSNRVELARLRIG
ncbi:LuxR C-terminal-related transcriptional regulator [Nocardia sp. NBC_01503]|uniref:helix-turn-helix transcriptional regulator n=1 Tax=Nocardia sp. NBC_01503 TaxID=2975997 RepID=UPI002E7BC5F7|nr:LuxR C-terminal-related transcriptional regulator [Nocardia sp. NBC_01503]WTL35460.1 LuxR C-terminal-related transcriptional regulator [Nocardia sp. NBC_01503]